MDLSVLVPLSGPPETARACLDSLERTLPRRWRYEVILGQDGPPVRAARLNAAARRASAPVLCLLDPGTTLMPGWLEPMLALLRGPRGQTVGCVGCVHREPYSGLIDHAGIAFDADGLPVPIGRNQALLPREIFLRCPVVSTACCLMKRDVFAALDGFDERFVSRFADVDFCLRTAERGRRHFVANRSVVYHHATERSDEANADLSLYRARWGDRARVFFRERAARRSEREFSPERWERAREVRRQNRQDVRDARQDGRRYLGKHWFRPWRYNYSRVCRALVQSTHPLPTALPRPPAPVSDDDATGALPGTSAYERDAVLFAPPRQ